MEDTAQALLNLHSTSGDATVKPPKYKPHEAGATHLHQSNRCWDSCPLDQGLVFRIKTESTVLLLQPGEWEPDLDGNVTKGSRLTFGRMVGPRQNQ